MAKTNSRSILLADDSQTFLMYVGILVKRLGYETFLARDGMEAIKLAKEIKPSIIVLDYMMPKIDGSSCLSIIKNDPELKNIPVILLTSYSGETARDEFEKSGCCHLLKKPINISEFYSAICKCMKQDNRRKNLRAPLSLKVLIECQNERRELFASNLSVEGMLLRTVAPFSTGTEMDIVFSIDDDDPIELKGKVIYNSKLSTAMEPEPGMGIKFLDIPEDIKFKIHYFIMKEISNDLMSEGESIDKTNRDDFLDTPPLII